MNNTEYRFDTLSGQVMHQEWGNRHLYFLYDDSNQPYALLYRNGNNVPALYYYLLNIQGDVVGLMDENQQIQALYRYDPWGAVTVLSADGSTDTSSSSIGMINPLRYRGYYYDSETGFYYLETRYYDPALGRFLNADTYSTTDTEGFLSYNMFAYCENDPVNRIDKNGEYAQLVMVAAVGMSIPVGHIIILTVVVVSGVKIGMYLAKSKRGKGRAELKKQGLNGLEKKKNKPNWKQRCGKKPRTQPRPHHPSKRGHRKYGNKKKKK